MNDIEYYKKQLSLLNMEELHEFLKEHPDFLENLEPNPKMDALKEETWRNIIKEIVNKDMLIP